MSTSDISLLKSQLEDTGNQINITIEKSSPPTLTTAGEIQIWKQYNNFSANLHDELYIRNYKI